MAWEVKVKNGLRFLCSSILSDENWLEHGVSLADQGEPMPFNLGFTRNDEPDRVCDRRARLLTAVGLSIGSMVCGQQVHGRQVAWVEPQHIGVGFFTAETALPETDGLATDITNVLLMTFHADCVPILLADPVHHAVAAIHAGWKGTASAIVLQALEVLKKHAGTNPKDCLAAIGPAAGPCCYEVGRELEAPMEFVLRTTGIRFGTHLNLPEINRRLLLHAGLKESAVDGAPPCTICGGTDFFSFRRESAVAGRMGSWILRKKTCEG